MLSDVMALKGRRNSGEIIAGIASVQGLRHPSEKIILRK
jgi:hypothetical protein